MSFDFTNLNILIPVSLIVLIMLIVGYLTKKSIYPLILLLSFIAFLVIHYITRESYINVWASIFVDIIGLIVSISSYLIIDEVESRRERISEVFTNKYKEQIM